MVRVPFHAGGLAAGTVATHRVGAGRERRREAKAYAYHPVRDREEHTASGMVALLDPCRDPEAALTHFLAGLDPARRRPRRVRHRAERTHVRRRHRRYLLLAVAVEAPFGTIPLVVRSTLALRLAVERAANEEATCADVIWRHRVGTGLERLCAEPVPVWCAVEALRHRAKRLRASPAPRAAGIELTDAAGLMALAAVTIAVAAHATGDVPSLLATLRR